MPAVLADTHAVVWYLEASPRLSAAARNAMHSAIQAGEPIFVSPISLVEIAYLEEKRRLPGGMFDNLLQLVQQAGSGLVIVPFDLGAADAVRQIPAAAIPDMPDRMIAATAMLLNVPIVTADAKMHAGPVAVIR